MIEICIASKYGFDSNMEKLEKAIDKKDYLRSIGDSEESFAVNSDIYESDPYEQLEFFNDGYSFILNFLGVEELSGNITIKKTKLEELAERCRKVIEDNTKAPRLLPIMSGVEKVRYNSNYFKKVTSCYDRLVGIMDKINPKEHILTIFWNY